MKFNGILRIPFPMHTSTPQSMLQECLWIELFVLAHPKDVLWGSSQGCVLATPLFEYRSFECNSALFLQYEVLHYKNKPHVFNDKASIRDHMILKNFLKIPARNQTSPNVYVCPSNNENKICFHF